MAYKTIFGVEIMYPYNAAVSVHKSYHLWMKSEIGKEWSSLYTKVFDQLQNVETDYITLREENKRLRYENEFMLRIINEREQ